MGSGTSGWPEPGVGWKLEAEEGYWWPEGQLGPGVDGGSMVGGGGGNGVARGGMVADAGQIVLTGHH